MYGRKNKPGISRVKDQRGRNAMSKLSGTKSPGNNNRLPSSKVIARVKSDAFLGESSANSSTQGSFRYDTKTVKVNTRRRLKDKRQAGEKKFQRNGDMTSTSTYTNRIETESETPVSLLRREINEWKVYHTLTNRVEKKISKLKGCEKDVVGKPKISSKKQVKLKVPVNTLQHKGSLPSIV